MNCKTTKLYRPTNKKELDLIQDSGWKKFPPRLPDQPIFYPVTNQKYASQITTEWNLPSYKNGFVTEFELSNEYLSKFKVEKVGLDHHTELWVPAEQLEEFNNEIIDKIRVVEAYHIDPNNHYVMAKENFLVNSENCIAIEIINKSSKLELTQLSKIESYSLQNHLERSKKEMPIGEVNHDSFIIKLQEKFATCPIESDTICLIEKSVK